MWRFKPPEHSLMWVWRVGEHLPPSREALASQEGLVSLLVALKILEKQAALCIT